MASSLTRLALFAVAFVLLAGCSSRGAAVPVLPADVATEAPPDFDATDVAKRYLVPTGDGEVDGGGATILVQAPMEDVMAVITDYARYDQILPRLEESRIVTKGADSSDVYMRAPVLDSMAIWGVMRFTPPSDWRGKGKRIDSHMVKGNLKRWSGSWMVYPLSENETVLRIELIVDVNLPVPAAWITPETMWAADKGVTAVRDIAEKRDSSVKSD